MKKVILVFALFAGVAIVYAQQQPQQPQQPRPPSWAPESTEWYHPEVVRVTPGVGGRPPSDAIVLFDGTNLDKWESSRPPSEGNRRRDPAPWRIENGELVVVPRSGGIQTKEFFGDVQLHIEFKAPPQGQSGTAGVGQNKGNSGVFLQNTYEVQVLCGDNNPTYVNGMVGSIYKQAAPLVNPYTRNGEWQVYDIYFKAPVFDRNGLVSPAMMTVVLNGVVIQNNYILKGHTPYTGLPAYTPHGLLPLSLQDHGEEVRFRNIWIRVL